MTIDPELFRRPGGVDARGFCCAPHPTDPYTWCRRQPGHPGDHAAYTFHISRPETWPPTCD